MEKLPEFKDFLLEATANYPTKTVSKRIKISFECELGKVEDEIVLAMSPDSTGLYTIGKDVEKFCGIPEADVKRDVDLGKDRPEDAIIYGMSNTMNGGADVYFWTNGTRLSGVSREKGIWPAILEQVSHECTHLTRQIFTRFLAAKEGADIKKGEWITHEFGGGEYVWPAVGDLTEKAPLVKIDEESFATGVGLVVQAVTPEFLKMAAAYIPSIQTAINIR